VAGSAVWESSAKRGHAHVDLGTGKMTPDRRRELRVPKNQDVRLKILGWAGLPNPMEARIVDVSGSGMRLHAPRPVECGASVEIDAVEMLILGEVCRCQAESTDYALGVRITGVRMGHSGKTAYE
jgi:hypothetical protein